MLFGLTLMVLAIAAGLAVDYGRMVHARAALSSAADAAALAGGRALLDGRMSVAEVTELTKAFFEENSGGIETHGTLGDVKVTLDRKAGTARLDAEAEVGMTFMRLAGVNSVKVPITAVTQFDQQEIELAMVLDVTGSMYGTKIADLRSAAKDAIDILLPSGGTPNKVRIGLAPYADSVNAGAYASVVTNGKSTGCVHERSGKEKFTDAAPGAGAWLRYSKGLVCPHVKVQPLTNDSALLKSQIGSYTAGGMTAGHLGTAWGWYLVSPDWASVWPAASAPAPHDPTKTLKAIILMTDGEFNKWYVNGNGDSSQQAANLCTNMKKEGVIVYSVAFKAPPAAETLLRNCASSPDHYFATTTGTALRAAFQDIAKNLGQLRLTQ